MDVLFPHLIRNTQHSRTMKQSSTPFPSYLKDRPSANCRLIAIVGFLSPMMILRAQRNSIHEPNRQLISWLESCYDTRT